MLAKRDDAKFSALIKNKDVTLHFTSDDGVSRHYIIKDQRIEQALGAPSQADLTVNFADSLSGVRLLAKGDTAALMSAIQSGAICVTGDYKLVLWFASLTKHLTKLSPKSQAYLNKIQPVADKLNARLHKLKGRFFK